MEKWRDIIPFSADDLKLFEADRLACKIEECYWDCNVSIKIRKKGYNPCCGDGFKFEVKLNYGTRIESVEKFISTVQYKLKIPVLKAVKENGVFYLATYTSHTLSLDNDLSRILKSEEYRSAFEMMNIAHPVGVGYDGKSMICDLDEYPHAVVSGTTRSGKSTALKCLLVSLLKYTPDKMNFLIADRGTDLTKFSDLPHLSMPIIFTPETLAVVLLLLKDEMERRNTLLRKDSKLFSEFSYIVCVIDEFPWFINEISNNNRTENTVEILNDILRFGRHVKIHFILSIHDLKNDIAIIEQGDIPVKLNFQVANSRKSINNLGNSGAEKLSGKGDMIFNYSGKEFRLQGVYMNDDEIDLVVQNCKQSYFDAEFSKSDFGFSISDEDLQKKKQEIDRYNINFTLEKDISSDKNDWEHKFVDVILWTLSQESVSINLIQQNCSVGNKYAKQFFDKLLSWKVIGESTEKGRQKVIVQSVEELPNDLQDFLYRYGISDDRIIDAFGKKCKNN